jgi:acyl-CoA reductase-like NAD-dependent aldehyde dehydrogenase
LTAIKLAPILAGGNTVVLKPFEFASASTLELTADEELSATHPTNRRGNPQS